MPDSPRPRCEWCGEPAISTVEIEKPRYRNDNGRRVLARPALEANVCRFHMENLQFDETKVE